MRTTTLCDAKFLKLVRRGHWEYVERNRITGIVAVVPVTDDGRLVLVEQFREPVQCNVLELPAGLVGDDGDPNETLQKAAERELLEETGYHASKWVQVAEGPPSPGLTNEVVTFFHAAGLAKVARGGGVEGEEIKIHEIRVEDVPNWLVQQQADRKVMTDPKVFAGLFFAHRFVANNLGIRPSTA